MTIQILGEEDQILDSRISSEEKWSLYVDQFVQLSSFEHPLKVRNPFLRRNLPAYTSEDLPLNVETKSGLELKICVNTYKIFFVDNTEDYFYVKPSTNPASMLKKLNLDREQEITKSKKFRFWLNSK